MQIIGNNNTFIVKGDYNQSPQNETFTLNKLLAYQYEIIDKLVVEWAHWYNKYSSIPISEVWTYIESQYFNSYEEMELFILNKRNWARNKATRHNLRYSNDLGRFI